MKLWEKNFLITYFTFLILLNSVLGFLVINAFSGDMNKEYQAAEKDIDNIAFYVSSVSGDKDFPMKISRFNEIYRKNNAEFEVKKIDKTDIQKAEIKIATFDGKALVIKNTLSTTSDYYDLTYKRNIDNVYEGQKERFIIAIAGALLLSLIIGCILYMTMKRINKPIDNIAHELRTPLTNIQGYAQYMSLANVNDEDREFAMAQVLAGSKELTDIVERLLLSSNLRNGRFDGEEVEIGRLAQEIKIEFPQISIEEVQGNIFCDRILTKCLLRNLISNGLREGSVRVYIAAPEVKVCNTGTSADKKTLKSLNKNKISASKVKGNGFGLKLCYDIVKFHGWRLTFAVDEKGETVARIKIK